MAAMQSTAMDLIDLNQRPVTADEFHAMDEAGVFHEYERLELIDGRLIVMEPIGWEHVNCVNRLTKLLVRRGPFDVSPQNPLRLSDYTEPQPDLVLLREDRDPYGPILGPDALVVIEVSDASLNYDRGVKLDRYAKAQVPEVWIVDVNAERVEVNRGPSASSYREKEVLDRGDSIAIPGGLPISIIDIFPERG